MAEVKNVINHVKVHELVQISKRYFEQAEIDSLRAGGHVNVNIYFDTFYILAMVQGFWELQASESSKIHTKTFDEPNFLVKGLTYLDYFENVKILLPHVAELLKQLDKTYLLPLKRVSKGDIDSFLEKTGLKNLKEIKKSWEENRLDEFIQELTLNAQTIFKANYVLTEVFWHKRFNHLFDGDEPIITYDNHRYDHHKILESDIFHELLDSISTGNRISKTINNFRDAMSLCMILQKIEEFNSGHSSELPIFFLTPHVHKKLPKSITDLFVAEYDGKKINILKDAEFFILDAMFKLNANSPELNIFQGLINLSGSANLYTEITEKFAVGHINEIVDYWVKFRNQDFFQRIWEDSKGGKARLADNLKELISYDELEKNDEEIRHIILSGKEHIARRLNKRVGEFVLLEEIWKEASTLKAFLKKTLNPDNANVVDSNVFTDEGLIRFSPPRGVVEEEIKSFWRGLLDAYFDDDEEVFRQLKVQLTRTILEGLLKDPNKIDRDQILIGISILWVFGKKALIIKIVDAMKGDFDNCYPIILIYTACLLPEATDPEKLSRIQQLITQLEQIKDYGDDYKLWIGVAYLKFNLWEVLSNTPFVNTEIDVDIKPGTNRYFHYLQDALDLSKKAYEALDDLLKASDHQKKYRQMKYYYALNNFIYYTIRCKDAKTINSKKFHHLAVKLQNIQSDEKLRESRFSDTLAHYYYTLSQLEDEKTELLEAANSHINDAIKTSVFIDKRFESLHDRILVNLKQESKKRKGRP